MPEFSPDQLSGWTRGTWQGDARPVSGVGHDTRRLAPGMLYLAIAGERFDGHDFMSEAQAAGATAALVHREVASSLPLLRVEDTRQALFDLRREALSPKERRAIYDIVADVAAPFYDRESFGID